MPSGFFHFLRPTFCSGTVLPSFNGFYTVFEAEYQSVIFLRSDCRYFIVKNIRAVQDFLSNKNECMFRDLFGWAEFFAHRIEGAADPYRAGLCNLSAVMLFAATAYHHPGEGICLMFHTGMGMFVGSAFNLLLHSVKLSQRDDWLVAVRYVVLRQLTVILHNVRLVRWFSRYICCKIRLPV